MSEWPAQAVVVVGVDGTETSSRAVHYALGVARRLDSAVVAVHVLTTPATADPAVVVAAGDACRLHCAELQSVVTTLAAENGVRLTFVVAEGDPASTLLRVAEQYRADAIVVGASKALVHRFFGGSTAQRAVRYCPCPVTVVP